MANMVASLLHTITSHSSDVNCVAFSYNTLASCSGDKTVRLWSVDDFSELPCSPLLGHQYYVNCVVFSPFGTIVASCSTDGKVILWDVKTGDQVGVLQHPSKNGIRVCRFSPDSSLITTGGDDNTLCLWEVSSRKLIRSFSGHDEMVAACAFTPDSHFIVSGSTSGDLRIWDAKFGHGRELGYQLDAHDLGVHCCIFSPTYGTAGKSTSVRNFLLATGGRDNLVKLWIFTGQIGSPVVLLKLKDTLPGHTGCVLALDFSPKGDVLASGSNDKTIRLWNALKGTPMFTIEGHGRYVTTCAISRDGQMLASGSNDKTVMIWKLTDTTCILPGLQGFEEPEKAPVTLSQLIAIEKWSVEEVCSWIISLGLQKYEENFRQQAIDGVELLALSSNNLEESLGIAALGHRNKILRSRTQIMEQPSTRNIQLADNDLGVPDEYLCPITREVMHDPVMASDGYTYDKNAIKAWIESGKERSPMTNALLVDRTLTSNRTLKMLIQRHLVGNEQG